MQNYEKNWYQRKNEGKERIIWEYFAYHDLQFEKGK